MQTIFITVSSANISDKQTIDANNRAFVIVEFCDFSVLNFFSYFKIQPVIFQFLSPFFSHFIYKWIYFNYKLICEVFIGKLSFYKPNVDNLISWDIFRVMTHHVPDDIANNILFNITKNWPNFFPKPINIPNSITI